MISSTTLTTTAPRANVQVPKKVRRHKRRRVLPRVRFFCALSRAVSCRSFFFGFGALKAIDRIYNRYHFSCVSLLLYRKRENEDGVERQRHPMKLCNGVVVYYVVVPFFGVDQTSAREQQNLTESRSRDFGREPPLDASV